MPETIAGDPPPMAPRPSQAPDPARDPAREARRVRAGVATALAAALALGGCAGPRHASVVDAPASADDRFGADGRHDGYTAVVPRAYLSAEDLDEDAPNEYTVVSGDTLWDISDRFLKKPWLWTEIWNYNPEIANPHLIFPGDELALEYVGGQPTLVLSRNGRALPAAGTPGGGSAGRLGPDGEPMLGAALPEGVERMSPRIRTASLDEAVPTVPAESIRQFLVEPRVVALEEIGDAPYVVGNDDRRLMSALGHRVYARGDIDPSITRWGVYRKGEPLEDPVTGEPLGHEIEHVADATLRAVGDPSTLAITKNRTETIAGDILLPLDGGGAAHAYVTRLPELRGEGRIVSLVDAISQSGRNQVVVLNLGERSGVAPGDLLAIETSGGELIDPRGRGGRERVALPDSRTGVVMVFRTFDKVSYALVVESTRPVMANDRITGI